uniref:Ig-like domain-containing protein n=1 Tax=Sinocyclocheilus rhinocerous TaxID=307959 RepID=A0A673KFI8_9TELE
MKLLWNILLCLPRLLGVLCAEADEIKMVSVKAKDSNTHLTDLSIPEFTRLYRSIDTCPSKTTPSSKCALRCSVANSPDATLTLYNGSSLFSITKVADLNLDLSLCMYVEYQDTNAYSCVLNDPFSKQTTKLDISQLCQMCLDKTQTPVSVTEGDSVTLHTDVMEVKMKDQILWMFECRPAQLTIIAEILNNNIFIYDCDDLRFKDRLQLDGQTGNLTITNTNKTDSGVYKLQINNGVSRCWGFNVTVYAHLPVPVISRDSSSCSSSSSSSGSSVSRCVLLCSVVNVGHVTLSWYKGNSLLSSISVSDLNSSLCLEVDYQNNTLSNNTYSCVVSNSFTIQTEYVDITKLCSVQFWTILKISIAVAVAVAVAAVVVIVSAVICFRKCNQPRQEVPCSGDPTERNQQENEGLIPSSSSHDTSRESILLCKLCWD